MAGKLRFAAKLLLGTSVLAAGGAGVYYGTTIGWPAVRDLAASRTIRPDAAHDLGSARSSLSGDDLDAVASAWAEPAPGRQAPAPDSSAEARTAAVEPLEEEPAGAQASAAQPATVQPTVLQPAAHDRYAFVAVDPGAASTSPPSVAEVPVQQVAPEVDPQPLVVIDTQAEHAPVEDGSLLQNSAPEPAVARGQEPDEATAETDEEAPSAPSEPQPLRTSGEEIGIGSANLRGRDAFREQRALSGAGRYGSMSSPVQQLPSNPDPPSVNPFGSERRVSDLPSETADVVEPLPAMPDEAIEGELPELQEDGNDPRELDHDRTVRATGAGADASPYGGLRADSLESLSNSEFDRAAPRAEEQSPRPADGSAMAEGTGRPGERALEGPQRPALEIQKLAPGEIQVGKPAKFVVQIRNIGAHAADGVTIRDEVPQGTRLISTTPTAEVEASHLVWELGKLSPGEDRTVEIQLMPTAEGDIGSVATVSYSAQASVKTRCTMPQLAIRMTAPEKVLIGQEQRVKIELRNPGSGDASGVMLLNNVPQTMKHPAGPALEFEIGTLRAGETRELELVLLAEEAGKTVNVLSARGEGNLQVQQQVEFEVIAPVLAVDVEGPERRYLERPATYEVSVENPGTAPAHDVQIVTKLPKGMQFVRANNMGEYDAATHAVYWSLAELPEGERGTVELVTMPVETGPQTLEVESRAGLGLSDQAQQQVVVDGLAALMFELRDLTDPIEVGRETGYEIRVVNQGTKAATNVQVAVQLPPGMQLVSAEGETPHSERRGAVVFEPLPQLAPKADTLYRVVVQGTQAGDQRVAVEVDSDDFGQPIRREESTRVFGDE